MLRGLHAEVDPHALGIGIEALLMIELSKHKRSNVDAFMQQAHEYAAAGEGLDVVYKILSTLALTHPMHTVRAAELQRWVGTGEYDRIVRGEYVRRGTESSDRPLRDDVAAAGSYYASEDRELAGQLADVAKRAADRAREAFRNAQKP